MARHCSSFQSNYQKRTRQISYLQAIDATGGVDIFFGRYQEKSKECRQCHSTWTEYEEKMSDVRIATELLRDAFKNSFDTAILVSADADLLPPIEAIKEDFPSKSIVIWFPLKRDNRRLQRAAHATSRIGKGLLSKCQLPNSVTNQMVISFHGRPSGARINNCRPTIRSISTGFAASLA